MTLILSEGHEIALPQKYTTISERILSSIKHKEFKILKCKWPHSVEMFGVDHRLPDIQGVTTDCVEVILSTLLDSELVGINNEFFHGKYEEISTSYHTTIGSKRYKVTDRVYVNFYNSDWFKWAENRVHREWGPPVNVMVVFFHLDKPWTYVIYEWDFGPKKYDLQRCFRHPLEYWQGRSNGRR